MADKILTLAYAKTLRESRQPTSRGKLLRGITDAQLAALSGIGLARIKVLESMNVHKAEEPWLDEACAIARVLGVPYVAQLIGRDAVLADIEVNDDPYDDLEVWRTGVKLPLRFGIRLGRRFGIEPLQLLTIPAIVWEFGIIAASGERTSGACPWCNGTIVGGAGHLPTCTMGALFAPRDLPVSTIGVPPYPEKPGTRAQGSKRAPGLKRLREGLGITQEQFAASIGKHPAYYARLEQGRDPLNTNLARLICAIYKVTMLDLYA